MKSILRLSFLMLLGVMVASTSFAQDKSKRASPPMSAEGSVGDAKVSVTYSAPSAKGRTIWGELVPYGKVWRAGANEATTLETDKDLMIGGKKVAAGKYSIFLIPNEGEWTFVLNSVSDQWGAYQYDEAKDVVRISAKPVKNSEKAEMLTYKVVDDQLWIMWDDMKAGASLK